MEGHLGILQKYTPTGKLSAADAMQTYTVMAGQVERLTLSIPMRDGISWWNPSRSAGTAT